MIPWSPLARGRITRDWDAETARSETDEWGADLYVDEDRAIVETVARVAERLGCLRAQVGLAWLLHQPTVTAPIVGVTKPTHLADAVAAVDLDAGRRRPGRARRRLPAAPGLRSRLRGLSESAAVRGDFGRDWWGGRDLNPRVDDYESSALTELSYRPGRARPSRPEA